MRQRSPGPVLLNTEIADFVSSGLSVTAASRDARNIPSICRVLTCTVSPDLRQIKLLLVRSQARQLLQDIHYSGSVAVVFSLPSSHRTLQIKGEEAKAESVNAGEIAHILASTEHFASDLVTVGFERRFTAAFHHFDADDLCGIVFKVTAVYEQSPGVNAGQLMSVSA